MRTNSTQNTRQRQIFHDDLKGLFIAARFDHVHITLDVQTARTCQTTGRLVAFVDGKCAGNGLGIFFIGGFF